MEHLAAETIMSALCLQLVGLPQMAKTSINAGLMESYYAHLQAHYFILVYYRKVYML